MTQLLDTTVYCLHQRWSNTVTRHLSCTQRGLCDSCRSTMIIEIAPWALDCSSALSNLQIIAGNSNWKGAWKKALSDFWSIAILSFQITLYLLEKSRKYLTLQKDSLYSLHPFYCWFVVLFAAVVFGWSQLPYLSFGFSTVFWKCLCLI